MQEALFLLLVLIFGLYSVLILYYWRSWLCIPDQQNPKKEPATRITVIIPARNEEGNIGACLQSIMNQAYPAHLFEVLVVDDHSTDGTVGVVHAYTDKNVKLISLKEHLQERINSYKKKAIETAVGQSTGELIVTTDADCLLPENWLRSLAAFYEEKDPVFIAAPVAINCSNRFIEIFQALDFMTLQGITGASVHKKIHSMCNGANLAYTKKAFEEVGGFAGVDSIASGDDMLLMHKIYKRYPERVMYLKSKDAIVQTAPVHSVREFFSQRIRWASKADKYDDKRIFAVLLLVYLVNVILLLLPLFVIFLPERFSVLHYHLYLSEGLFCRVSLVQLWLLLILLKTIIELTFLYPVAKFFGKRTLLWLFPLMQPVHILYTVIAGWLGKFGSYHWKQRKVK